MLKRYSLTALVRILGAGANLFMILSITWLTGAEEAGIFLFGYSIMIILATFSRLGSELSGLREVAALRDCEDGGELSRAVRARLMLTVGLSLLCACSFSLFFAPFAETKFSGEHTSASITLLAFALPALAMLGLFTEFLKAVDRATIAVLYQNTTIPVLTIAGLGAASLHQTVGAEVTAAAMLFGTWVTLGLAVVTWLNWRRTRPMPSGKNEARPDLNDFTQIIRDSPTLLVVSSTSIIMQWIGSVMLGLLAEPRHVAGFSVAVRLSITVSIVNSAIISVMAPRMAAAHAAGKMELLRLLSQQTSLVIMAAAFPILLVIFTFAATWLSFFGSGFSGYATELRTLVLGQIASAAIGHSGTVLVMAGLYREARLTSIIAGLVLLGAMLFAIPVFGTIGASVALSFGVVAGHLAGAFLTRQHLSFWTMPVSVRDIRDALKWHS